MLQRVIEPPRTGIPPVVPPVAASWRRIDAWLARHAPARPADLRPPATTGAIDALESRMNLRLPDDLRASLLCHDGDTSYLAVLPCGPLYSTEQIAEVRQLRMEVWEDSEDSDEAETPWWREDWIPFAGGDGDDSFVDAGRGMWRDHLGDAPHADTACFLGWPSLGAWLHEVAEAMEHHGRPERGTAVARPIIRKDGWIDW
ncbi:SMI1/KNR4 family protein [Streptomyces sp. NPDC091649]|uniref:SMI1/KNR4 family protein n=1 Tax=Streptomyces sp. NPDC091649 TaxID=3366004 RepID=UPI003805D56B